MMKLQILSFSLIFLTIWDFQMTSSLRIARSATNKYIRPCYFTNWSHYRQGRGQYFPEEYNIPGLCTHIVFAFGTVDDQYKVKEFDPADLPGDWSGANIFNRVNALKQKDTNLKTLLSIGGWNFGAKKFQDISSTFAIRKIFIDSAIVFVRKWNFDGIDLDWEYPEGESDKTNMATLFQELRSAVEAESQSSERPRLLVTAAVSPIKERVDSGYDVPKLANALDFLMVMTYDYYGTWLNRTGHNSPLYPSASVPQSEKTWSMSHGPAYWHSKGMPKSKIIIGMPTYGHAWTLNDPKNAAIGADASKGIPVQFTKEAGIVSYYEVCSMLEKGAGAKRYWDDVAKVPYVVYSNQWIGYDDTESFMHKVNWLKREGYGGAFVWTLDFDDFNAKCSLSKGVRYPLISLIAKELGGVRESSLTANSVLSTPGESTSNYQPPPPKTPAATQQSTNPQYDSHPNSQSVPSSGCTHGAFIGDKRNCNKYFRCVYNKLISMDCPAGTSWDVNLSICNHSNPANCPK